MSLGIPANADGRSQAWSNPKSCSGTWAWLEKEDKETKTKTKKRKWILAETNEILRRQAIE